MMLFYNKSLVPTPARTFDELAKQTAPLATKGVNLIEVPIDRAGDIDTMRNLVARGAAAVGT